MQGHRLTPSEAHCVEGIIAVLLDHDSRSSDSDSTDSDSEDELDDFLMLLWAHHRAQNQSPDLGMIRASAEIDEPWEHFTDGNHAGRKDLVKGETIMATTEPTPQARQNQARQMDQARQGDIPRAQRLSAAFLKAEFEVKPLLVHMLELCVDERVYDGRGVQQRFKTVAARLNLHVMPYITALVKVNGSHVLRTGPDLNGDIVKMHVEKELTAHTVRMQEHPTPVAGEGKDELPIIDQLCASLIRMKINVRTQEDAKRRRVEQYHQGMARGTNKSEVMMGVNTIHLATGTPRTIPSDSDSNVHEYLTGGDEEAPWRRKRRRPGTGTCSDCLTLTETRRAWTVRSEAKARVANATVEREQQTHAQLIAHRQELHTLKLEQETTFFELRRRERELTLQEKELELRERELRLRIEEERHGLRPQGGNDQEEKSDTCFALRGW